MKKNSAQQGLLSKQRNVSPNFVARGAGWFNHGKSIKLEIEVSQSICGAPSNSGIQFCYETPCCLSSSILYYRLFFITEMQYIHHTWIICDKEWIRTCIIVPDKICLVKAGRDKRYLAWCWVLKKLWIVHSARHGWWAYRSLLLMCIYYT